MKKIKLLFVMFLLVFVTGCNNKNADKDIVITTNFPAYDFARAIVNGSSYKVEMLVKPGFEIHDFDPTPKDIININNSKLFIYNGGESEDWVTNIIKDNNINAIKLMDFVTLLDEEIKEGMENDDVGIDEHIWTSPVNAIKIVLGIRDEFIKLDPKNEELYMNNSNKYIQEIKKIDEEIREIVNNAKRKELVFADRFPIRYFVSEYGLTYYAAFLGCSHSNEASPKTIAFLINKVKEDNIPVIFHIEMSNKSIANTIASETNAKVLEFNSAHNISQDDFDASITYVDIMKRNIEVLKEALN